MEEKVFGAPVRRIESSTVRAGMRAAVLLATASASMMVSAGPKPARQDPVIVPETAVAVDHLQLIGSQKWTPLNRRMLLVHVNSQPHLLIFDSNCPRITERGAMISTRTPDITLHPRTDVVYVSRRGSNLIGRNNSALDIAVDPIASLGDPCQIDRMYSILPEDLPELRKRLEDTGAEQKKSD